MGNNYYNITNLKHTRKNLRNNSTEYENLLWQELKGSKFHGLKFRRQHSIGRYIIDFYCSGEKIGIEIDGNHHLEKEIIEYDEIRTKYLETAGIKIIRFTNIEIENNLNYVLEKLKNFILK